MKKRIISVCLSAFILFACKKNVDDAGSSTGSQIISQADVPAAVMGSFNTSFSSSTEREWRHGDHEYYCQFNMNDQRHEAEYEDNGHEDSHSVICLDAAVPQLVLTTFGTNFPNDVVYEWKLTNDNTWKAHFLRNAVKYEVTISASGDILKTEHD